MMMMMAMVKMMTRMVMMITMVMLTMMIGARIRPSGKTLTLRAMLMLTRRGRMRRVRRRRRSTMLKMMAMIKTRMLFLTASKSKFCNNFQFQARHEFVKMFK